MSDGQAFSVGMAILFAFIAGGYSWEAWKTHLYNQNERLREMRELRRINADLRDEVQRLRQR